MSACFEVIKVGFSGDGSCAYVTFRSCDLSEESLCFLFEIYSEHVKGKSVFDEEEYSLLQGRSEYSRAILAGMRSLACSSSTRKEMRKKLLAKGFSAGIADEAVLSFCEKGYIKESELIVSEIKSCLRKKYGRIRIRSRLASRGFPESLIRRGMDKLCEYDFSSVCSELARKRASTMLLDEKGKNHLYSYLCRYGYTSDEARSAVNLLIEED